MIGRLDSVSGWGQGVLSAVVAQSEGTVSVLASKRVWSVTTSCDSQLGPTSAV